MIELTRRSVQFAPSLILRGVHVSRRELGSGSYATVYAGALDTGEEVAIKQLHGLEHRTGSATFNVSEALTDCH
jgi:hypothetical protein